MSSAFPEVFWLRQQRTNSTLVDPVARTRESLTALSLGSRSEPGQTVAVGVGSRGIANLSSIVATTVEQLKSLELVPFVVSAMGSHGGATSQGQTDVLAGYGITEADVGCPVRAQMDTVELCTSELGLPVHFDTLAANADHVVMVNRVKPHTTLDGPIESGLAKMLLIGFGNQIGAQMYHRAVFDHGWPAIVSTVAPEVLSHVSVLAAMAVVENADDETAMIEAMPGEEILSREPTLLASARDLLPRLPFDDFDIVLIDAIGKDVSGTGWDTNTLGRKGSLHSAHPDKRPRVRTVVVRGLTERTHGNAMGIGLAELCRSRVIDQMDRDATWINAQSSGNIPAGMLPIHHPTDRELLDACITRNGLRNPADVRIGWIHDTLDLGVLACSAVFLPEARERDHLTVLSEPAPLPFDGDGNLPDDVRRALPVSSRRERSG